MKHVLRACAITVALAVGVPTVALSGEAQSPISLEGLLALARERNSELASMRYEAQAAGERVIPAGALPDPRLRVELEDITRMGEQNPTLLPNKVGGTRYTLMQDLPWSGKRDLKSGIAALEAQAVQARAMGTWADVSSRIKSGYAQLYAIGQSERLTREILELMASLENVARGRYAGGLAAQQDVIRAQVEQTNLKNELLALAYERHQTEARLNALVARPASAPLAPPERLSRLPGPASLDATTLENRVRERNPQLFSDDARLKAAEKTRDLAYKNRYPDFAVGIAPLQSRSSIKEWMLMVELNIPLQQSSRRAQEREAEAMLAAARSRKEATATQVLTDLAEALFAFNTMRRTEALIADSLLPQAELTFRSALASYQNGKADFATLLDAQRQIRQAKQNQIKAQADARARLADIERLLGEEL